MSIDIRDRGEPGEKEWQEFRASYAAARLFVWLLDELDEIAPDYVQDLRDRINEAICAGEGLAEDDPTYDGAAVLRGPSGRGATFIDKDDAHLLEDQLFPTFEADSKDFKQATRGLAVVALHSALEAYCDATAVTAPRTPLPLAVQHYLAAGPGRRPLDSELGDRLTELDETRHLVIHNRGVVSARYAQNVRYNTLQVGEFRVIDQRDLERYADAVWRTAVQVREARPADPPTA